MATIKTRKGKNKESYQIYFYLGRERKTLSLDRKYTRRQTEEIALYVQKAADAIETGSNPDKPTQAWLDEMTDDLRKRFVRAGLIEEAERYSLERLIDEYYRDQEKNFTANTISNKTTNTNRLMTFFGAETPVEDLTQESVEDYRDQLLDEYAQATVGGAVKTGHALFAWAVKKKMVEVNPFDGVSAPSMVNKEREYTITREYYRKLLDACPDQTWRTLLALCRIGGLRNPCETLGVKWTEVNWDAGTMLVHAPKTERYAGKDTRLIPLFPDLRVELERQFEQAEEGAVYVIDRWRDTSKNMRTYFKKIIFLAGLEEWPRLFHNLRGSRDTELFSAYPEYVATAWMGHSKKVAFKHYLHPTDTDFQKALAENKSTEPPELSKKSSGQKIFDH